MFNKLKNKFSHNSTDDEVPSGTGTTGTGTTGTHGTHGAGQHTGGTGTGYSSQHQSGGTGTGLTGSGGSGSRSGTTGTGTGTGSGTGTGKQSTAEKAASFVPGTQENREKKTGTDQGNQGTTAEKVASFVPGTEENREKKAGHTGSGTGTGTGYGSGSQGTGGQGYSTQGTGGQGYSTQGSSGQGYGTQGSTGQGQYSQSGSGMTGGQGQSTIGGGRNLAQGEYSVYQPGQLEDLSERRTNMQNIQSSTPGVPHLGDSQSFRETVTVASDKQPWQIAMEKTQLASQEVAGANMAAESAAAALRKAEQAEQVVEREGREHNRLLTEAERQRDLVGNPMALKGDLDNSMANLAARQEDAARHNRSLREADSAVASKQGEFDRVMPLLKQHDQTMHGLADEYDSAVSKSRAVHEDADRLRALAAEDEAARSRLARLIEELMEKIRLAEEDMVAKERAFLAARDNHRGIHNRLRELRGELDGVSSKYEREAAAANSALESARRLDERTAFLRNKLQEEEREHNRLLELIQRLKAELEAALADLERLRREGEPEKRALNDAEARVVDYRRQLREAEEAAKSAEARYRALVREADGHKAQGAEAANAAQRYTGEYQEQMKEAKLHGDRHKELWREAEMAGDQGSANATEAFRKLEGKVQQFMHEP